MQTRTEAQQNSLQKVIMATREEQETQRIARWKVREDGWNS